jgi:hypothetical protein
MARFSEHTSPDPKYEQLLELRDKVYLFLKNEDITNAGVGVGRNNNDFALVVHLESDLPANIRTKLQERFPGTEIEVVGQAKAY